MPSSPSEMARMGRCRTATVRRMKQQWRALRRAQAWLWGVEFSQAFGGGCGVGLNDGASNSSSARTRIGGSPIWRSALRGRGGVAARSCGSNRQDVPLAEVVPMRLAERRVSRGLRCDRPRGVIPPLFFGAPFTVPDEPRAKLAATPFGSPEPRETRRSGPAVPAEAGTPYRRLAPISLLRSWSSIVAEDGSCGCEDDDRVEKVRDSLPRLLQGVGRRDERFFS